MCVPFILPKFNLIVISFIQMEKKQCMVTKIVFVALRKYQHIMKQQEVLTPTLQTFIENYSPLSGHFSISFFQGQPNPGFRSVKIQTETFFKKDSQDFKNSFYLGFL